MQIVFMGTPSFAVPCLEALLSHPEFTVRAVVTQPDKPRGRGKKRLPSAVKQVAIAAGLTVLQPPRIKKDTEMLEQLQQWQADVFVVVAYGQLLSPQILALPKRGCINLHGSLLPKYRGAAPIQWSLAHGDRKTGLTTLLMDEGMDTGPMLLQYQTPVDWFENAHQLASRLALQGGALLTQTLLKLEHQQLQPTPQSDEDATYAPLIQKSDFALDWSRSALELHHQIRGFYPNCTTTFGDRPCKILATVPLEAEIWQAFAVQYPGELPTLATAQSPVGQPGEVVKVLKKLGPVVQTGAGQLLLRELQLSGKRPQSGWDFSNGNRLTGGEVVFKTAT